MESEIEKLKEENEQLKLAVENFAGDLLSIEDENNQLKQTIKQLRQQQRKQSRKQYESDKDYLPYTDRD